MHIEVQIEIPDYVNKLMAKLNDAGYEAWCVGGCVRDSLLGRIPEDWDLAVSSLPPETKQVFSDYPTFDVGMRHGTISVLSEGHTVELTTFRMDGVYSDARHPDSVQFSNSLEEDLSRRDFTVNAMAYRQNSGLRDPFDGLRDLETGLLRCVGIPAKRFSEDALRVLRCLRFSSTLGFAIEPETLQAAMDARGLLEDVSRERVRDELQKLLCGTDAAETLRLSLFLLSALCRKAEADGKSLVHPVHGVLIELAHLFFETVLVDCAYLFQKHNGIFHESGGSGIHFDMGGQICLIPLAGDRCRYYSGTEFISHIVLHDKDRPHTSLLGTDYGAQICIIDVSSVYYHGFHSPVKIFH